jgi:hypothetical protein
MEAVMALDKYRALVEAADKSEICVEDLRALRTMLPASDEELDEVLAGLVENPDLLTWLHEGPHHH